VTQQAEPDASSDAFRLYDTATQSVRTFEPVVPGRVSIYHCGLTVQAGPHQGHNRK
jgi:cysteinyl-tRNA synthetase